MKKIPIILAIILIIISAFLCGFTYSDISAGRGIHGALASVNMVPSSIAKASSDYLNKPKPELVPTNTYVTIFSYIESDYYGEKPESDEMTYAAIRGMLASLGDIYTRFMDPKEYSDMQQQDIRGDFSGIGALLGSKDGDAYIEEPFKNSPAMKAGLKPGDIILKVNDELVHGIELEEVANRIKGPVDTPVKLTIKRIDEPETLEFTIIRKVVSYPIIESKIVDEENKIGYISLRGFNEKSDQLMDTEISELEKQGIQGLVFDLRGNGGGLLDMAISISSRFIKKGNVVWIQDRGGIKRPIPIEQSKHNHKIYPTVVLINGSSASASEIVAGAIQDHEAGVIVGTDSFGKGLVQTISPLPGGSAVAITIAKYLTPDGHYVDHENKIHPDIVIEPTDEDIKNQKDVQLDAAIKNLKERMGKAQTTAENTSGK